MQAFKTLEEEKLAEYEKRAALSLDPRFLVFEFVWNIVLRKKQVRMSISNLGFHSLTSNDLGCYRTKFPGIFALWRLKGTQKVFTSSEIESHWCVPQVRQLIMGAGKTTVIAPLLALMLADGKNLVLSIMPKALLEMSRSLMRETFSSIMVKRVYTLNFDRSTRPNICEYFSVDSFEVI